MSWHPQLIDGPPTRAERLQLRVLGLIMLFVAVVFFWAFSAARDTALRKVELARARMTTWMFAHECQNVGYVTDWFARERLWKCNDGKFYTDTAIWNEHIAKE